MHTATGGLGPQLWRVVLAASLTVSTAEFIELQSLPPETLRARFSLPETCLPVVTAVATDPAVNRMAVSVECRPGTAPDPPPIRPRRTPGRAGGGS
jgi:hypothetical protein